MKEIDGRFFRSQECCAIELSKDGLSFGGRTVIRKVAGLYEPVTVHTDASMSKTYKGPDKSNETYERLQKIAGLLQEGKTAEAIFLATFTNRRVKEQAFMGAAVDITKYNFNPLEPRDIYGRWTKEYESDVGRGLIDVAYPGTYHDQLLADTVQLLKAKGYLVVTEVRITGLNGITARADAIVRPVGGNPHILEIKTGAGPTFTPQQDAVYPIVCTGPHSISPDPKISQIGYSAGDLLPQMDVWIIYSPGPGQKTIYFNGCDVPAIWRH